MVQPHNCGIQSQNSVREMAVHDQKAESKAENRFCKWAHWESQAVCALKSRGNGCLDNSS